MARMGRATAVTAGAALAAAVVAALRRRLAGLPRPPGGDGPGTSGVREPRVPTPSGGSTAAAAEPPAD